MLININSPIIDGETVFKRKRLKNRIHVYEGGELHLERMYASGGLVVSVFHNYKTNAEELRYLSIKDAISKYEEMRDMRQNTPEWVSEHMLPAILKAIRAAQRQEAEAQGFIVDLGDPTEDDIEEMSREIAAEIAKARQADPELDEEMTRIEMEGAKNAIKKKKA